MKHRIERKTDERSPDLNQFFIAHYSRLMTRAIQMASGSRSYAEELIQEVFAQLVINNTNIDLIDNPDGYLRRMLRYIHIDNLKKAQRTKEVVINVPDWDSLAVGLLHIYSSENNEASLQVRADLVAICRYACIRKDTSRIGSIFILRYIYDYTPTEISRIIKSPRFAVDNALRDARREVKLYLKDPTRLKFISNRKKTTEHKPDGKFAFTTNGNLIDEMCRFVISSCKGACLTKVQLKEIYTEENGKPVSCEILSHLVSCPYCMTTVCNLLGIAMSPTNDNNDHRSGKALALPITTHISHETSDEIEDNFDHQDNAEEYNNDDFDYEGSGGGGSIDHPDITGCQRRARQIIEHRPDEIYILADHILISTQKINWEVIELNLKIGIADPIEFIEVCSNRGISILLIDISQFRSTANSLQKQICSRVDLSDDRKLEVTFEPESSWLHLIYTDPLVKFDNEIDRSYVEYKGILDRVRAWYMNLGNSSIPSYLFSFKNKVKQESEVEAAYTPLFSHFSENKVTQKNFYNIKWGISVVCILAMIAMFVIYGTRAPRVTAAELIQKAIIAENNLQTSIHSDNQVIHRIIKIEERESVNDRVISRQSVDIWRNPKTGEAGKKLYDETGRLISGEWTRSNGMIMVWRRGLILHREAPEYKKITLDNLWLFEPSASGFKTLIGNSIGKIVESDDRWQISYDVSQSSAKGGEFSIVKAVLILQKDNLHATEQLLRVRTGDSNSRVREFKFIETAYERPRADLVEPKVFEPDAEIPRSAMMNNTNQFEDVAIPDPVMSTTPALSAAEDAALRIKVYSLLDKIGAVGEDIRITSTTRGTIDIEGIFESQNRKREVLQALQPLTSNPAVRLFGRTYDERAATEGRSNKPWASLNVGPISGEIPAYNDIRAYLEAQRGGKMDEADLNSSVVGYSNRVIRSATDALSSARELKIIGSSLSIEQLQRLTLEERNEWVALIVRHSRRIESVLGKLRKDLEPIYFKNPLQKSDRVTDRIVLQYPEIIDAPRLYRALDDLFETVSIVESSVKVSLSLSTEGVNILEVGMPEFKLRLLRAEFIAKRIQDGASGNNFLK